MIKIKKFNFVLTMAAMAALFLLLPPDKDISKAEYQKSQASFLLKGDTTKTHQQLPFIRGNFLHSA